MLGDPAADPHAAARSVPCAERVRPLHGDAGRCAPAPHGAGDDLGAGVHDHPAGPAAAQREPRAPTPWSAPRSAPSRRWNSPCGCGRSTSWVHEQDLRVALGKPGNLDSPGAYVARDCLLEALPKVVAKDAGAPANSAVVFDVHGPVEFLRTVRVDADGRGTVDGAPSLGPVGDPRHGLGDLRPPGLRAGAGGRGRGPGQGGGRPGAGARRSCGSSRSRRSRGAGRARHPPRARRRVTSAPAHRQGPRRHAGTCTASTRLATSRSRSRRTVRPRSRRICATPERLQDEHRRERDPVVVAGGVQQHADRQQGRHRGDEAAHVDDARRGALALRRDWPGGRSRSRSSTRARRPRAPCRG